MAKMGDKSRSFLRYRELAEFCGNVAEFKADSKAVIAEFMKNFDINDRNVFFAENLNSYTKEQMIALKKELAKQLKAVGYNGVVEFHPTSDQTSKSAHIHLWGTNTPEARAVIEMFVVNNRLSNKNVIDYTNEKMTYNTKHTIAKNGELKSVTYSHDKTKDTYSASSETQALNEDEIAAMNETKEADENAEFLLMMQDLLNNVTGEQVTITEEVASIEIDDIIKYFNDIEIEQ